jgi:centromeric protein E
MGLDGNIFAYGHSSSGKTYTMQGSGTVAQGSEGTSGGGIVQMAAQDVFSHVSQSQDRKFLVRVSCLEMYNEEVRDVLADHASLQIHEDLLPEVFVPSKEKAVKDFNSLLGVLAQAKDARVFASTAMKERSSRSHNIVRITITSRTRGSDDDDMNAGSNIEGGAACAATLTLVDMAGSESVSDTGATGDQQNEGGMIDQRYAGTKPESTRRSAKCSLLLKMSCSLLRSQFVDPLSSDCCIGLAEERSISHRL